MLDPLPRDPAARVRATSGFPGVVTPMVTPLHDDGSLALDAVDLPDEEVMTHGDIDQKNIVINAASARSLSAGSAAVGSLMLSPAAKVMT